MKTILKLFFLLLVAVGVTVFLFYQTPEQKAFKAAQAQSRTGDAVAQKTLADFYLNGRGVKPNVAAALEEYSKAAAAGHAGAALALAEVYISGQKVPQDFAAALTYLKVAALNGSSAALVELGRFYYEGLAGVEPMPGQGVFWWLQARSAGEVEAKPALERAQTQDPILYEKATQLFDAYQAALNGDAARQLALGRAYNTGDVLEKDAEASFLWTQKAAQTSLPAAAYALGELYAQGVGTPTDASAALEWYTKAADAGYPPAEYELAKTACEQAQAQEKPDYSFCYGWAASAAGKGYAPAQYLQGFLYMRGQGVTQDTAQAAVLVRKAAEKGFADAQYVLGQMYAKGLGIKVDKTAAKKWMQLAADNGNPSAAQWLTQAP